MRNLLIVRKLLVPAPAALLFKPGWVLALWKRLKNSSSGIQQALGEDWPAMLRGSGERPQRPLG